MKFKVQSIKSEQSIQIENQNYYIIKDSKRTMKNNKKKQLKPLKKQQKINKKIYTSQKPNANTASTQEIIPIQTILSPTTQKLMYGFSQSQKKIISDQFNKMIKKLKIKLTSPEKVDHQHRSKLQTKTQRFQLIDPNNCSKQTIKKAICTDRKVITTKSPKSPKTKNKTHAKNSKILSPKRSSINKSSQSQQIQYNHNTIASPFQAKKSRFVPQKQDNPNKSSNIHIKDIKRRKAYTKDNSNNSIKQNYFLLGERFVEINESQVKELESEVIMEHSMHLKDSQLQFFWGQFKQKKRISRNRIQSEQQIKSHQRFPDFLNSNSKQNSLKDHKYQQQKIKEEPINVTTNQNLRYSQDIKQINQDICKQFYNDLPSVVYPKIQQQKKQSNSSLLNIIQGESYSQDQISPISNKSKKSDRNFQQQDLIKTRKNAIQLQMKTNRQILIRLLQTKKINKSQYQQHMDLVIEIYDKQMTQIENLKQMIEVNEQKIDSMIKITNQSLKISEKLGEIQVQNVLDTVFGPYKKQLKDSRTKISLNTNNLFKQKPVPQQKRQKKQHLDTFSTIQVSKKSQNLKLLLDTRTAHQLSIIRSNIGEGISTSVLSVFQFIKNFLYFIKNYHLGQFLTYVNMPYGYSVEQRLKYMQGYDDAEQNQHNCGRQSGIIYGLQQVFHPNLLSQFHNSLCYKPCAQSLTGINWKQVQKIHNKAIFDALNQAINRFRPYFLINGCPYNWTTTQKALTYYFIRQDCCQELFQKVQTQVLKWSSSLCGLLIPKAVNRMQIQGQSKDISLQKIFQKYTVQTQCQLLQHREQKIIKQEKIQIEQSDFQWNFHDQYKTALLYELSSCILEELTNQLGIFILFPKSGKQIHQLYYQCEVSQSQIEY